MMKFKKIIRKFPLIYKVLSVINYYYTYYKHKKMAVKNPEILIKHVFRKYNNIVLTLIIQFHSMKNLLG